LKYRLRLSYTFTRNQTWEGRYELTDHLGNVRVVFRKPLYDTKWATLENGVAADEEAYFQNLLRTRSNEATSGNSRTGSHAARLNALENTPIGPLRTLTVQKGDSVQALAYGHYTPVQNNSFLFDLGSFLASSFVFKLSEPTATEDPNGQKRNIMPYVGASFALSQAVRNTLPAGVPEAYLKYIAYDKDWKVVASGEKTISTTAQQAWEELRLGYEAQQDGYVEVFVANGSGQNVYFDDIQVKHGQGMVVQENHYYAFGKEIPELHYLNGASKNYRNAYQGQYAEKDDETDWNNFELRMYDSRIGRWMSTDPYGQYASPYVGMGNNPVSFVDPNGGFDTKFGAWLYKTFNGGGQVQFANDKQEWFVGKQMEYAGSGVGVTYQRTFEANSNNLAGTAFNKFDYGMDYTRDFTGGIKDFVDTYNEMKDANWRLSDKYFHSKANFKATLRGPGGEYVAERMSNLREITDQILKGDPRSASEQDQEANKYGREQAKHFKIHRRIDVNYKDALPKYRPSNLPSIY
jgi:RHS repeat-associated protein